MSGGLVVEYYKIVPFSWFIQYFEAMFHSPVGEYYDSRSDVFLQRLPASRLQAVQQRATGWIGQGLEDGVHAHAHYMQLYGCLLKYNLRIKQTAPESPPGPLFDWMPA